MALYSLTINSLENPHRLKGSGFITLGSTLVGSDTYSLLPKSKCMFNRHRTALGQDMIGVNNLSSGQYASQMLGNGWQIGFIDSSSVPVAMPGCPYNRFTQCIMEKPLYLQHIGGHMLPHFGWLCILNRSQNKPLAHPVWCNCLRGAQHGSKVIYHTPIVCWTATSQPSPMQPTASSQTDPLAMI